MAFRQVDIVITRSGVSACMQRRNSYCREGECVLRSQGNMTKRGLDREEEVRNVAALKDDRRGGLPALGLARPCCWRGEAPKARQVPGWG
jgi:hypothetical protein